MNHWLHKKKKGFTLVEVLIVVAIIAILSAIAIPFIINAKVTANESTAKATLKSIASALENYATINSVYPSATSLLIGAAPPYLNKDYFTGAHEGYTYTSVISDYSYVVTGAPTGPNQGHYSYTMSTGGVLAQNP